jgi:predicted AAA+ superfamily ATPase
VLSVAGLARDAGVARTTVDGYLGILADTHLAWLLPAFEARLRVKERRHPKLYWTDSGVVRGVRREFHPPTSAERGPLFEGWIGQLLRGYGESASGTGHPFDGLWYWAPSEGQIEVDFLIKAGKSFFAVEAKAKTAVSSKDFAGLRAIHGLAGVKRRVVVYLGDRPQRTEDGIDVLPVREFLAALEQRKLW